MAIFEAIVTHPTMFTNVLIPRIHPIAAPGQVVTARLADPNVIPDEVQVMYSQDDTVCAGLAPAMHLIIGAEITADAIPEGGAL